MSESTKEPVMYVVETVSRAGAASVEHCSPRRAVVTIISTSKIPRGGKTSDGISNKSAATTETQRDAPQHDPRDAACTRRLYPALLRLPPTRRQEAGRRDAGRGADVWRPFRARCSREPRRRRARRHTVRGSPAQC